MGVKRLRGMALLIVLICTTLLAMLTASFMMVSRANASLYQRSDRTLRAAQCCYSGLDYVRSRLQHDRDWGNAPLGTRRTTVNQPNLMTVQEEGLSLAANTIEGQFVGEDARFQVRFANNLRGSASQTALGFSRRALDLPPKSALVVVEGYSGSTRRHLEALLCNDFFASSPLAAGSDLALTTRPTDSQAHLFFTNPVQEQNSVKSRAKTYMPAADRLTFGTNPNSGAITGKDDVVLDARLNINNASGLLTSVSASGISMDASPAQKTAAETQSKATILPSRDQRAPMLDGDALKKGPGGAKTLPAGKYVFTGPGQISYFSNLSADPNVDTPSRTYTGAIYDGGASSGAPGTEAVIVNEFHFVPRGEVESPGSVVLESNRDWLTPQLSLGYSAEAGMTRGEDPLSSWKVTGDMTIKGNVAGNGSLIANGSGVIEIQGKTQLAQSPDSGVAIYADQSVRMRPPSPSLLARSDIFDKNDFNFIRQALASNRSSTSGGALGLQISSPQDLTEWRTPVAPQTLLYRQQVKVGTDDQLYASGLGSSPVIRDQGILYTDYVRDILPNLTGYGSNTTPLGRPLTALEQSRLASFLDQCSKEGGTSVHPNAALTIGRHVRIKEFLRSCDRQVGGDSNWLTVWPSGQYNNKVQSIVMNLSESMFEEAEKSGRTDLFRVADDIYNQWGDKDLPDVDLRGIVYSGGNFFSSTSRSFRLWGAIATHSGSVIMDELHIGQFHFDGDTMEKLLDLNKVPLIPVNWAIDS